MPEGSGLEALSADKDTFLKQATYPNLSFIPMLWTHTYIRNTAADGFSK